MNLHRLYSVLRYLEVAESLLSSMQRLTLELDPCRFGLVFGDDGRAVFMYAMIIFY